MSRLIFLPLALVAILVPAGIATAAEPPELERALVQQAPAVIRYLKNKGYANVGVLKFLVVKNGKEFSDNVGPLNLTLAEQLELALVVANVPRQPVGIVRGASSVAQRTPGANHLTRAGRLKLFEPRYPLAWGKQQVAVDAFVTGLAHIAPDLRTTTITLLAFDKEHNSPAPVLDDFVVTNRPKHFGEMGESFVLRGGFDNGSPKTVEHRKEVEIVKAASQVKQGETIHPIADTRAPVRLKIYYDQKLVKPALRHGQAFVPEPNEGQKVRFVIERDGSQNRYGMVFKVNGESAIRKQRLTDLLCKKFILDPGDRPITIRGFLLDDRKRELFRVLSAPESKAREMNYGEDVGMLSVTVFQERKGRLPAPDISDEGADTQVVANAKLPEHPPETYGALKEALLAGMQRSLIAGGEQVVGPVVKTVKFEADPTPVMSLTVRYYQPKKD